MGTYYLQRVTNLKNVEDTRYKPRFDHFRVRTIEDMANHLEQHHVCSRGSIMAAMSYITKYLAEQLQDGNKVRWDGIGVFEPSLAADGIQEVKPQNGEPYLRVEGLHIDKVAFRPDKNLIKEVNREFSASRSQLTDTVCPNERAFTREQRIIMLEEHFAQNHSITIKEYASLTFQPLTSARKELHEMASGSDANLVIEGRGSHIRFVKKG